MKTLTFCLYCWLAAISSCAWQQRTSQSNPAIQTENRVTPERSKNDRQWSKVEVPSLKSGDLITFSNSTVVIAGQGSLLLSLDEGQTWRTLNGGEGSHLYTNDGGKTFRDARLQGNSSESSSITLTSLCSVESAAFEPSGRLYLSTTCDHSSALWSIPIANPADPWHVRSFAPSVEQYESKNDSYYGPGRNLVTSGQRILVDASLPARFCLLTPKDQGVSWDQVWCDPSAGPIVALDFVDEKQGWMLRGDGKLSRTDDGGHSWVAVSRLPPEAAGHIFSLDFVNSTTGFVVGENGLILSTKDAGRSWQRQTGNTNNSLYKVAAATAKKAWAVGEKGTVLETNDGGTSWRKAEFNLVEDISNLTVKDGAAWFVVGNHLFRSS